MAQSGYTPIFIYSSSTASNTPSASNLTNGTLGSELAINIADGKLFYKDTGNNVQVIAWKTTPTTAGGTGLTSFTAGDLPYYATGTALSKLGIGAANTVLTSSGTAPQWSTSLNLSGSVTATQFNGLFVGTGPVTVSGSTYSVGSTDVWIINNYASGTMTITLPTASSWTGRCLRIQNYQAQNVVSASSNVVPQAGGSAGTAILTNIAGNWATLVSNGTNWVIMQAAAFNNLLLG